MKKITKKDVWLANAGELLAWTYGTASVRHRAQEAGYEYGTRTPDDYVLVCASSQWLDDDAGRPVAYKDLPDGESTKEETAVSSDMDDLKYLAQVYRDYDGSDHHKARSDARAAGFRFYTWGTQTDVYSVARGWVGEGWRTRDLEGPQAKFMEYISDPKRSMREDVFRRVTGAGFFSTAATPEQIRILTDLYSASGPYCKDGIDRFYAAMGDAMPPRGPATKVFTVQVEVPLTFETNVFMEGAQRTLDKEYVGSLAVKIVSVED